MNKKIIFIVIIIIVLLLAVAGGLIYFSTLKNNNTQNAPVSQSPKVNVQDLKRQQVLESAGYDVTIVWESDLTEFIKTL